MFRGITGWAPVDASEAAKNPDKRRDFFGAHDEDRFEFSIGGDLFLNPKPTADRLNYFIYPYAEVDGKTCTSIDKNFAYGDLTPASASGGKP